MKIDSIQVINFRIFTCVQLSFEENLNVIVGKNGVGKSSILESIGLVSTGRSYKTRNLQETINQNNEETSINAVFKDGKTTKTAKVLISKYFKKMWLNGTLVNKVSDFIGFIDVVTFSSFDVISFLSSPSDRRKMFDSFICGINPEYLRSLQKYNNLVKEKNKLLRDQENIKNINIDDLLDIYDEQLYLLNKYLINVRKDFVKNINSIFMRLDKKKINLVLKHTSNFNADNSLNEFCKNRNKDLKFKSCSVGIHKDDYNIDNNDMDLCIYGSQGQIKQALILLKICFATYIKEDQNRVPILLFDDVLGDLDYQTQNKLINIINNGWQIIISTPSVSDLQEDIAKKANIIFLD